MRTLISRCGKGISALVISSALIPYFALADETPTPTWIVASNVSCKVWNPDPHPGEELTFLGGCKNGFADGSGTESWSQNGVAGNIVSGTYRDGHLIGRVTVKYPNGIEYIGTLQENGQPGGAGTKIHPNGTRYTGDFRDGKFEGQGVLILANGEKYVGHFQNGHPNGEGVLNYADGGKYTGHWVNGLRDGQGTMRTANGGLYTGLWSNGKASGYGKFKWANGDQFIGEFANSRPTSNGKYIKHHDHTCGIIAALAGLGAMGTAPTSSVGTAVAIGAGAAGQSAKTCQ